MPEPLAQIASVPDTAVSVGEFFDSLRQRLQLKPLLFETLAGKVVRQAAHEAGLSVSTEELQQATNRFRQKHGLRTKEDTQRWLESNLLRVIDLETILEQALLTKKFRDHLAASQIEKRFHAEPERFARTRISSFALPTEGLALELLARVRDEGAEFDQLAREHAASDSGGIRRALVLRAELLPSAAELVFGAKPDSVVGPVADSRGWHLFHVLELLPPQLDTHTVTWLQKQILDDWLRERLANVRVDLSILDQP